MNDEERNGLRKQRRLAREKCKKLQSNWNSLREWLISYRTNIENPDFYEEGIIDCIDEVLDKMNELEGVKND